MFHKMIAIFRFREDEVRAEMGEREVQKLQKEVDKLEVNFISFYYNYSLFTKTFSGQCTE